MNALAGLTVLTLVANAIWQSVLLAAVGLLASRLFRARPARVRHLLWIGVLCAAIALPLLPRLELPVRSAHPAGLPASSPVTIAQAPGTWHAAAEAAFMVSAPGEEAVVERPNAIRTRADVARAAIIAYFIIVCALVLRLLSDLLRMHALKRRAVQVPLRVERIIERCRRECRVRRAVTYGASSDIGAPVFVGLFRPMLLLPSAMLSGTRDDEIAHVSAHELAHAERRDDWLTLFERLGRTLCFFNPVMHWLTSRIALERELACDEWAITRAQIPPDEYARTLLHVGERALHSVRPLPYAALNGSSLRHRIEHLLASDFSGMRRPARARVLAASTIIAAAVTALAAAPSVDFIVPAPEAFESAASGTPAERLNDAFDQLEAAGYSGAILVSLDGEVVIERGFGVADRRDGQRNTATTRFPAGAIAKMLTAAAILKLEEQGKLSVQDPLSRWFGPLPEPKDRVTLHHLLTHAGGLTREGEPEYHADRGRFIEELRRAPAEFAPGSQQRHTDIGYSALAAVVELASGMSYETYVRTHLLEPAGMRDTWFEPEAPVSGTALEYSQTFDARSAIGRRPYVWGRRGAMGIVSTVQDLTRWQTALANGLFQESSRARMYDVAIGNPWGSRTGYGWQSRRSDRGTEIHEVLSGWPGNSVELMHDPAARLSIALFLNNRVNWSNPRHDAIARIVLGSGDQSAAQAHLARAIRNW